MYRLATLLGSAGRARSSPHLRIPVASIKKSLELKTMEYLKRISSNRLARLALLSVLGLSAAFSFVRYISWSFAYSGILGLPSQIEQARRANHLAWIFLCMFLVCEVLLSMIVASSWEPPTRTSATSCASCARRFSSSSWRVGSPTQRLGLKTAASMFSAAGSTIGTIRC